MASNDVGVDIAQLEEVKWILKNLDKKISKRYMVDVFRRHSKPLIKRARELAPKSEKKAWATIHRHYAKKKVTRKTVIHKPGDLKRSIKGFVGKSKMGSYWVGAQVGSGKNPDAYYATFVEFGTKERKGRGKITGDYFMKTAFVQTKEQIISAIANQLKVDIQQYIRSKKK